MNAPVSRRSLLGAAAALGAVALPAATPALAGPAEAMSPEAATLQAEAGRLSREHREAGRQADDAAGRVEYPDPPEALYAQVRDYRLFARNPVPSWSDKAEGRHWWAEPEIIEGLRGGSFRYLSGRDCPEACARRDEVVAAFDGWHAADRAVEDAAGYTAAMDRFEAVDAACRTFRQRLVDLRTADPEVLTVKAMLIVDLCGRDEAHLDRLIVQAREGDVSGPSAALALSMARDFIGLFGASAWVSA